MNKLFKPKTMRRILLFMALIFPVVYLCGGMFFALNGMHGKDTFISQDVVMSELGTDMDITYNAPVPSSSIAGDYFSVKRIEGYSTVVDDAIVDTTYNSFSNGVDTWSLPNIPLRSLVNRSVFDYVENDGTYYQYVRVFDLGNVTYYRDGDNFAYIPYPVDYVVDGYSFSNGLTYSPTNNVPAGEEFNYFYRSGAGYLEVYKGDMSIGDVASYYAGKYVYVRYKTPIVTNLDVDFSSPVRNLETFYIDSSLPSFVQLFLPSSYEVINKPLNEYVFGSLFGGSNFISSVGSDVMNGTADGFAPMNDLFKYVNDDVLHFDESDSLAVFGFGYLYYAVNVIVIYEVVTIALKLLLLPLKVVDKLEVEKDV